MEEKSIKDIDQTALDQFHETGHIDGAILDLIITNRQIDIKAFRDKQTARDLWHNLIKLSLIDPPAYEDFIKRIKNTAKELGCKNDIPDIVA